MTIKSEPEALPSGSELPCGADEEPSIPSEVAEDDPSAFERDRLAHRLLTAWAMGRDQE